MAQIGSFALLFALACSAYCMVAGLIAILSNKVFALPLGETARRAGVVTFALVFLAAMILVVAAFENNFSIAYILHHSNRDLPAPYKFATLWSGQEGSLLFWALLLSAYGLVLRLRYKTDVRLFACASVVVAAVRVRDSERKDAVYENLRDLNFEYKAGRFPDVDYASLKSSLQDEAATLLAEITRLETTPARETRNAGL